MLNKRINLLWLILPFYVVGLLVLIIANLLNGHADAAMTWTIILVSTVVVSLPLVGLARIIIRWLEYGPEKVMPAFVRQRFAFLIRYRKIRWSRVLLLYIVGWIAIILIFILGVAYNQGR